MRLNAYGRHIEVVKESGEWVVYMLGEGKKRRTSDISIPSELGEREVVSFLEDILHEAATPENSKIEVIG